MIPTTFRGVALQAVASGQPRLIAETAHTLGLGAPAMVQEVVRLVADPEVVRAHPRPCRTIVGRLERQRAARSGAPMVSEV